jgi:predicted site-specific integrase-resolvase
MMPYVDKWIQMRYISSMKLSQYAKQQGISYRTALRWWRAGQIKGYQAPSGTIIVTEGEKPVGASENVAIYARVSSPEQRENLDRQVERLSQYCMLKGISHFRYQMEHSLGVSLNRLAFEEHGVVLDMEPQWDEIIIVFASGMTRLTGGMP